jgi:hypothetical protein
MNFGEIPPGALRGFPPGWISIHHLAGVSHEEDERHDYWKCLRPLSR